jgi:hypothetical protein
MSGGAPISGYDVSHATSADFTGATVVHGGTGTGLVVPKLVNGTAWSAIAVRAGTDSDASAAAEVASLLAAEGHTGIVVDPAGLSGQALDRFAGLLRGSGLSSELPGQVPDGALIVAGRDGPQAGVHLIVRAGPNYTPAESAQLAVAGVGPADLGQGDR